MTAGTVADTAMSLAWEAWEVVPATTEVRVVRWAVMALVAKATASVTREAECDQVADTPALRTRDQDTKETREEVAVVGSTRAAPVVVASVKDSRLISKNCWIIKQGS